MKEKHAFFLAAKDGKALRPERQCGMDRDAFVDAARGRGVDLVERVVPW